MASALQRLDAYLATLLSDWGLATTVIAVALVALVAYPIIYPDEPDTHPLLLARQSSAAPVRNKYESAAYRSPETPYGTNLKSGLNVKDAGAPRWAGGKDGDLRDVWREVQRGGQQSEDGKEVPHGLIMTVLGRDEVVEHDVSDASKEIGILGRHWRGAGVTKVAVYLPNSMEYLSTIFACAFYGLTPILLPYNQPHTKVYDLINSTGADGLICAAGNIPLDGVAKACSNLKLLTWVVEKTSRHMDWNGVPGAAEGRLKVSVWHDVVVDNMATASPDLPTNDQGETPGDLIAVWQPTDPNKAPEIVTFTHRNLVSATAALISALPLRQRLTSADMLLPASSFTHTYVLCQTLAALFTHASLAINSVAGPGVDMDKASRGVSPTVIVASAETMAALHAQGTAGITSAAQRLGKYTQDQAMSARRMPTDGWLFRLLAPSTSSSKPGKLRLILTSERLGAESSALSSTMLSDLRIFTRARICYALTAAAVAGAIAQTNVFDYRRNNGTKHSHFGTPLSSVEIKLVDQQNDDKVGGALPEGEIVVSGPAVSGGEARLGVRGRMREDGTIAYA
ncbi:hypothetical protein B0A55_05533 [Friedmanniomyces simplex]|uniref:AMP-dependent synthetase/ligase domain-containing protein n=1 Tax=Friedmanniomyces simplex TaxID=329884 RepID=A0A4U0XD62_9PEZI|nr:hypothetical protein B0A55_05533 [Friedmanniomyces simplex]